MLKKITKKNLKYELEFLNMHKIMVFEEVILKFNLFKPQNISREQYQEIFNYSLYVDDYHKAIKYLSKPRSINEMQIYLKSSASCDKIIKELISKGYLNDTKYANWILDYFKDVKNQGPMAIKNYLEEKHVDNEIIASLTYQDEELKINSLILKKKMILNKMPIDKQKAYFYQFLLHKGFTIETILNVLEREI